MIYLLFDFTVIFSLVVVERITGNKTELLWFHYRPVIPLHSTMVSVSVPALKADIGVAFKTEQVNHQLSSGLNVKVPVLAGT